jgi:hypothetical protein
MARIRTIKPGFFRHEELYEAEQASGFPLRLIFAGLWTVADREGRFEWKPRAIKLDVLPYDPIDFAAALEALASYGFVVKYKVGARTFAHIPSWHKHQQVNVRESKSEIPAPVETSESTCMHMPEQVQVRGEQEGEQEREGEGVSVGREQVRAAPAEPQILAKPVLKKPSREPRGTRWPADAVVPDDWLDAGETARAEAGMPPADLRAEAQKFANYWVSKAGGATKLDWRRTWINWALTAKTGGANGARRTSDITEVFGGIYANARAQREAVGD